MNILVLDNYDSFTYNLVQYVEELLKRKVDVFRNDAIDLEAVAAYDLILLSPGPGLPSEAGIMPELLQRYSASKRILGVCLGHQAIGEAFGAKLENLERVYHGIASPIRLLDPEDPLFADLPPQIEGGRYHSWVVSPEELPEELIVTALDSQGQIMAMRHRVFDLFGLQFHPESIMTPDGKKLLANWLVHCGLQVWSSTRAIIKQ